MNVKKLWKEHKVWFFILLPLIPLIFFKDTILQFLANSVQEEFKDAKEKDKQKRKEMKEAEKKSKKYKKKADKLAEEIKKSKRKINKNWHKK